MEMGVRRVRKGKTGPPVTTTPLILPVDKFAPKVIVDIVWFCLPPPVDPLLPDLADRPTPSLQGFDPMRCAHSAVCQVIDDIAHILGPDSNRIHTVCVDMVINYSDKIFDQRIGN